MTMTLVETVTVGSGGAAEMQFSSIPATGTDILLIVSARTGFAATAVGLGLKINGVTTNQSVRWLEGYSTSLNSSTDTLIHTADGGATGSSATSNTFSTASFYIPNYAGSTYKSISMDLADESNATDGGYRGIVAGLWSNTSAITSLTLYIPYLTTTFNQYSTASLYTVTKGSGGASVS